MKKIKILAVMLAAITLSGCGSTAKLKVREPIRSGETMKVLVSEMPGEDPFDVTDGAAPDPFIMYDSDTDYYYAMSTQNTCIKLIRSKTLENIYIVGESKVVYSTGKEINNSLWAPEMYRFGDRWYIYSSGAPDASDSTKRLFVLESETANPFDGFHFKAFINNALFAIDPTVWQADTGKNYLCFSLVRNGQQHLAIAEMANPYTIGKETVISSPTLSWEGNTVNEGPFFVTKNGKVFIIYSANGCYDDEYCLGMLKLADKDNPLDAKSWKKGANPFLQKTDTVFAPGHASFFTSPDGTETWIAYQCYYSHNENARRRMRVCHVQPISFSDSGVPKIDGALNCGVSIPVPSGE